MSGSSPLTWNSVCQKLLQAAGMLGHDDGDDAIIASLCQDTSLLGEPDASMFTSDGSPQQNKLVQVLKYLCLVGPGRQLPQQYKHQLLLLILVLLLASFPSPSGVPASFAVGLCVACRQLVLCSVHSCFFFFFFPLLFYHSLS